MGLEARSTVDTLGQFLNRLEELREIDFLKMAEQLTMELKVKFDEESLKTLESELKSKTGTLTQQINDMLDNIPIEKIQAHAEQAFRSSILSLYKEKAREYQQEATFLSRDIVANNALQITQNKRILDIMKERKLVADAIKALAVAEVQGNEKNINKYYKILIDLLKERAALTKDNLEKNRQNADILRERKRALEDANVALHKQLRYADDSLLSMEAEIELIRVKAERIEENIKKGHVLREQHVEMIKLATEEIKLKQELNRLRVEETLSFEKLRADSIKILDFDNKQLALVIDANYSYKKLVTLVEDLNKEVGLSVLLGRKLSLLQTKDIRNKKEELKVSEKIEDLKSGAINKRREIVEAAIELLGLVNRISKEEEEINRNYFARIEAFERYSSMVENIFSEQSKLAEESLRNLLEISVSTYPVDFADKIGEAFRRIPTNDLRIAIEGIITELKQGYITAEQLKTALGGAIGVAAEKLEKFNNLSETMRNNMDRISETKFGLMKEAFEKFVKIGDVFKATESFTGMMESIQGIRDPKRMGEMAEEIKKYIDTLAKLEVGDYETLVRVKFEADLSGIKKLKEELTKALGTITISAELDRKFVTSLTDTIDKIMKRTPGGRSPKQHGGYVGGVGRGDIVPAMLEPGEFVVTKDAVDKFGAGFFYNVNKVAKYQTGGESKKGRTKTYSIQDLQRAAISIEDLRAVAEALSGVDDALGIVGVTNIKSSEEFKAVSESIRALTQAIKENTKSRGGAPSVENVPGAPASMRQASYVPSGVPEELLKVPSREERVDIILKEQYDRAQRTFVAYEALLEKEITQYTSLFRNIAKEANAVGKSAGEKFLSSFGGALGLGWVSIRKAFRDSLVSGLSDISESYASVLTDVIMGEFGRDIKKQHAETLIGITRDLIESVYNLQRDYERALMDIRIDTIRSEEDLVESLKRNEISYYEFVNRLEDVRKDQRRKIEDEDRDRQREWFDLMQQNALDIANALGEMKAAFQELFGEIKGLWKQLVSYMLQAFLAAVAKMIVAMVTWGIIKIFATIIGGPTGTAMSTFAEDFSGKVMGFHRGGVVGGDLSKAHKFASMNAFPRRDDRVILAQTGEGVLSRRGMNAIGGESALRAINSGITPSTYTYPNKGAFTRGRGYSGDTYGEEGGSYTINVVNKFENCNFTGEETADVVEKVLADKFSNREGKLHKVLKKNISKKDSFKGIRS